MKIAGAIGVLLTLAILTLGLKPEQAPGATESVAALLELFGGDISPNRPKMDYAFVSAERGKDIVFTGASKDDGRKSKLQSKHFTCLSCHNIQREDPDLANPNAADRLSYATKNNIPYVQGSTFHGIVNRRHFYNGDYEKKYGALVEPTRENIREAIQLCAVECSQGRALQDFEIESILAYFWTLELKYADLDLSEDEKKIIKEGYETGRNKPRALALLESKFLDHSPATFTETLTSNDDQFSAMTGNVESGQQIYELSCQHCHYNNNYSYLLLDQEPLTFKYLEKNLDKYREHSLAQVVRYGTSPKGGKKAYMPLYTLEKMTNQQLVDLRSYIEMKARP